MKPISYFTSPTLPRPSREDFTVVYAYLRGVLLWQGLARDWPNAKSTLAPNHTVEKAVDEEAFRAARAAHAAEVQRLLDEFKRDLFEDHGVTGHPKAERCFELAWENGHSGGLYDLQEVANYFDDFVDLIKD